MLFGNFLKTKHMKKYIKTNAKNAVKKELVKEGDEVWVKIKIGRMATIVGGGFYSENDYFYFDRETIRIPKPDPKPIDFSVAGRVLKSDNYIVMTTGNSNENCFSGYVLESDVYEKGYASSNWIKESDWQDITDTYKP